MTILTIVLLASITFLTRYLFLHPKFPLRIGAKTTHFLSFSAPAVLTAIWMPIIFVKDNVFDDRLTNPYLIAATIAIIVAYKSSSIYLTLGTSISVFILLRLISI